MYFMKAENSMTQYSQGFGRALSYNPEYLPLHSRGSPKNDHEGLKAGPAELQFGERMLNQAIQKARRSSTRNNIGFNNKRRHSVAQADQL